MPKNKGWLQPLIPIKGVVPVDEIDVLKALNDKDLLVVDMRVVDDRVKGTIPGLIGIPYTEVAMRMDEFRCKKPAVGSTQWDCSKAKKVYAFCNGPVCPQSPMAIAAITRDGFPATKIYYYRGGLGLSGAAVLPPVWLPLSASLAQLCAEAPDLMKGFGDSLGIFFLQP